MRNPDLNLLLRLLILSWVINFVLFMALSFYTNYKLRDLGLRIANIQKTEGRQGEQGIQGPQGSQGIAGLTVIGPQGSTGTQGLQGEQGPIGETGAAGPQGLQGPEGQQGPAGRTVLTRYNVDTGQYECRYSGDEEWQPIAECG